MKRFLIALLIAVTTIAATLPMMAEAKRLGGGGSFGKSSSYSRQNSATPTPTPGNAYTRPAPAPAPAAAPGVTPPKPASPWRGIVGGALVGLGLGAMMSHFGMGGLGGGGGFLSSILMIAVLAFAAMFLIRLFKRKSETAAPYGTQAGGFRPADEPVYTPAPASGYQPAYQVSSTPEIGSAIGGAGAAVSYQPAGGLNSGFGSSGTATASAGQPGATQLGIPADFDAPGFVRNAKSYFIRLQAAGDKADIHDIREFTTPEMFAELRLQIQERGASPNVTDVVQLNGDLLGIESFNDEYLATVRFSGLIKEAADASAEPFTELWNFSKPVSGPGGWVLAGIQQVS